METSVSFFCIAVYLYNISFCLSSLGGGLAPPSRLGIPSEEREKYLYSANCNIKTVRFYLDSPRVQQQMQS